MDPKQLFSNYFQEIYGERWPALMQALESPEKQAARVNLFSPEAAAKYAEAQDIHPDIRALWRSAALEPQRTSEDLLDLYIMDPASIFAAKALQVTPGCRVLDMCAAPGGKSLVIAEELFAQGDLEGELITNDLSEDRRERLKKVLQQYIPRSIRERVWIQGKDAVQFGLREAESYDRVLLDAPCSGERHLLENPKAMKEWSPRRTEHLATRQYSLLSAALLAVKPGGRIVYSTCSISPAENDDVIKKLLKKKKDQVRVLSIDPGFADAEKTELGWQFLPDRCGFGPIYFSVIEKAY